MYTYIYICIHTHMYINIYICIHMLHTHSSLERAIPAMHIQGGFHPGTRLPGFRKCCPTWWTKGYQGRDSSSRCSKIGKTKVQAWWILDTCQKKNHLLVNVHFKIDSKRFSSTYLSKVDPVRSTIDSISLKLSRFDASKSWMQGKALR